MSDPEGKLPHMVKPGSINWMQDTVRSATGCAVVEFSDTPEKRAVTAMQEFFDAREGRLLVQVQCWSDNQGGTHIFCMYTKKLTEEEWNEYQEVSREVDGLMQKRRAERAKHQEEQDEVQRKAEVEAERLKELGRICEQHHAPIVKALRDKKKGGKE